MPAFSAFTPFGLLEFSGDVSEAEKLYGSLRDAYRDPKSGAVAIDTAPGTYQEAKIYGWAMALADASSAGVRSAGAELRGETAYYQLEAQEQRFKMSPGATDTVPMRRAALAAKQKAARGPRYEAVVAGLQAILGSDFVAFRPMTREEATVYPSSPASGPGVFRRPDAIAKSIRLLTAITRPGTSPTLHDRYDESNQSSTVSLDSTTNQGVGQSFLAGAQGKLRFARFYIKKNGSPTGTAVVRVYAHVGTYGTNGVPDLNTLVATSDPLDVSTLTTSFAMVWFEFSGANRAELANGAAYVVTLEYAGGDGSNQVQVGVDAMTLGHGGNGAILSGTWSAQSTRDYPFEVHTQVDQRFAMEVAYENWNRSNIEDLIVKGDVLCVDPGNWGLAEKVTVVSASGSGTSRVFTAEFSRPHSKNVFATTGPMPLWASTKRHVLVIVKAAAAASPLVRARIHEFMQRVMRGPTTWSIVQPTTPGAATVGPFTLGTSPLGAVPVEQLNVAAPKPPFFGASPKSGSTGGGYTIRLLGEDLAGATSVTIDGVSVAFTQVSEREITFVAPSRQEGAKTIVVATPLGTTTKVGAFTYVQAALSVTSLTPSTGPQGGGTAVVVAGTGFFKAVDVEINGFTLSSWSIVDDNTINCTTDAVGGPGAIPLQVHTDSGAIAGLPFTFT